MKAIWGTQQVSFFFFYKIRNIRNGEISKLSFSSIHTWCLFCNRASATFMMTQAGRRISGLLNIQIWWLQFSWRQLITAILANKTPIDTRLSAGAVVTANWACFFLHSFCGHQSFWKRSGWSDDVINGRRDREISQHFDLWCLAWSGHRRVSSLSWRDFTAIFMYCFQIRFTDP